MAAISPSPDQTAKMFENLTLESQDKSFEVPEPEKETCALDEGNLANAQTHLPDRSVSPLLPDSFDPALCFYPSSYHPSCYYGSYGASGTRWGQYSRPVNSGGTEVATVPYGSYGYPTYGYQTAAPPNGNNVNGQQQQPPNKTTETPDTEKGDVTSEKSANEKSMCCKENACYVPYKPSYQYWPRPNSYGIGVPGYHDAKYYRKGQSGVTHKSKDNPPLKNSYRHNSNVMAYQFPEVYSGYSPAHGYLNRMYPNKFYGSYDFGLGYGYYGYGSVFCGQGCFGVDSSRYKTRGRVNGWCGSYNMGHDYLDERNRGPRTDGLKSQNNSTATLASKDQNLETKEEKNADTSTIPDRSKYNLTEFPENYTCSRFFVIKSYSEDDVHKSIKYNVWSSTPNGNKKLNTAYNEAQQNSTGCPIFLLFSVNTSGQFIGLAEMVGPVDFNKNVEYWQQDKWTGCFPVKWHIVKDLSNNLLKHITLENNENKPVTNSRDTQEVMSSQGIEIIKIFKNLTSKTCILDDFPFYEEREKIIREKKAQRRNYLQQALAKPMEDKSASIAPGRCLDTVADLNEDLKTISCNGDVNPSCKGSGQVVVQSET